MAVLDREWDRKMRREGKEVKPGPELILTAPGELPKAFIALVVVVEDTVQRGWAQIHQHVVGCLLLLPACVAIEQVVNFVCYF